MAVGTNEGEAIVLDGATLAPLTRVQVASDIWVSTLTLSAGQTAPRLAACAGDNSLAVAPLSDDALAAASPASSLWLSVLVAVVALLLACRRRRRAGGSLRGGGPRARGGRDRVKRPRGVKRARDARWFACVIVVSRDRSSSTLDSKPRPPPRYDGP